MNKRILKKLGYILLGSLFIVLCFTVKSVKAEESVTASVDYCERVNTNPTIQLYNTSYACRCKRGIEEGTTETLSKTGDFKSNDNCASLCTTEVCQNYFTQKDRDDVISSQNNKVNVDECVTNKPNSNGIGGSTSYKCTCTNESGKKETVSANLSEYNENCNGICDAKCAEVFEQQQIKDVEGMTATVEKCEADNPTGANPGAKYSCKCTRNGEDPITFSEIKTGGGLPTDNCQSLCTSGCASRYADNNYTPKPEEELQIGDNIDPYDPKTCEDIIGGRIIDFLNTKIFLVIKILVPIAVIVLGSVDLVQAVVAQDADKMKKAQSKFIKRLIIGVIIFFVPTMVTLVLNMLNSAMGVDMTICSIG